MQLLNNYTADKAKEILTDPAFILSMQATNFYNQSIQPQFAKSNLAIAGLQKQYMEALKTVMPEKKYYPDANSTLRLSYGKVKGYEGEDAVAYRYYTTLEGILQKEDSANADFMVPQKLKELYGNKDYGQYADANGKLPVAFTNTHHTTGGNSGSPLIDAEGNLIGINFDRNWQATANDIMYNDVQGRNIAVDIRYVLFVTDKFAGAKNLINEMKIIRE
jgi:hypothetical protein